MAVARSSSVRVTKSQVEGAMHCNEFAANNVSRTDHSVAAAFAANGIGREGDDESAQRGRSVIYDCVSMVALCNRADHYIFRLWLVLSSFLFFFARLISAAADWMSTIHMVWP